MKKICNVLLSLFMIVCLNQMPVYASDLDTVLIENGYELKEGKFTTWQTGNFDKFSVNVEDIQIIGDSFSVLFFKDGEYVDELELGSTKIINDFLIFTLNDFITPTDMKKDDYNAYLVDSGNVYELYNKLNDGKLEFDPENNLNHLGEVVPIGTKEDPTLIDSSTLDIQFSQKIGSTLEDDIDLYNITIKSNDPNYVKSIKKIIFYDGSEKFTFDVSLDKNCYIDSKGNLIIHYSELYFMGSFVYNATIFAQDYTRYVEENFSANKRIFTPVSDMQLKPTSKGLEIISSNYNFINSFTKPYLNNSKTECYIQFEKDGKTFVMNNSEQCIANKVSTKSDGKYYVLLSKDKLSNLGIEGNVKYNIVVKAANFEEASSKSSYAYKLSKVIPTTSIKLNKSNAVMLINSTFQLTATFNPSNTTDPKYLEWTSSNPDVARVDANGKVTSIATGTTTIRAKTIKGKTAKCTIEVVAPTSGEVIRIYGETRYETAFKSADALKEQLGIDKFNTVVIATGNSYPDALTGSYLASKCDAPILMANPKKINDVAEYVKNNVVENGKVYILGGVNAVSSTLDQELSEFDVERLAGETRYETNLLILEEAGVTTEDILICTGDGFADSLSGSATGKPILLVNPKKGFTDQQIEFLNSVKGNNMYVIGGLSAINDDIYNDVQQYAGTIERIGGANRNETSVLIAKEFFENPTYAIVAYAWNFPDGLAGGPLAMSMNSPLILTYPKQVSYAADYMEENGIKSGVVLGGPMLVTDEAIIEIFDLK